MVYQKSALYALASFALLFIPYSLRLSVQGNLVFSILVDGVNIGGWVFLWEAISTFAFRSRDDRNNFKHYKRFNLAPIRFNYIDKKDSEFLK